MLYEKIIAFLILLLAIYLFLGNFRKKTKGSCSNCSSGKPNKKVTKVINNTDGISIIKKKNPKN